MTRSIASLVLMVALSSAAGCKSKSSKVDNWQSYAPPSSSKLDGMQLASARRVATETAMLAMGSRNAGRLKQLDTWVHERAQVAILEENDATALSLAIACLEHPESIKESLEQLDALTSGKLRESARDVCEHPAAH